MIIIGITGTLGAGKGTIVEYLVSKKIFKHFSARAFLVEEIERRGWESTRDNMVMVANELRQKNSPSFVADELFKRAMESGQNCIIESLRTVGEIESLKQKGNFTLLAVDADPKIRYERILKRSMSTDDVSFEKFIEMGKAEAESLITVIGAEADIKIENNGTKEEFYKEVKRVIDSI